MSLPSTPTRGSVAEVFLAFLKLGLSSFGGPIAHLGYFRDELVVRRRWIDEQAYADLVALCQFLPGPASSQVSFALGLQRAGTAGALAAWAAFTLPSAILLILFALGAAALGGPVGLGLVGGLKIVAVAIVAHAVLGMARSLCPDRARAALAAAAIVLVSLLPGVTGQITAIAAGAGLGALCLPGSRGQSLPPGSPLSTSAGAVLLITFALLLAGLPLAAALWPDSGLALFDAFYRAGAWVFGGGHVVLPLLQAEVVHSGQVSADAFLSGYGAAQAVPGPLFSFAAYLGYVAEPGGGLSGALLALVAIFLPGLLLVAGSLPFWESLRGRAGLHGALQGANAAVVGLLAAALYDPVFSSAITGMPQFALAVTGFVLLTAWKAAPWLVVLLSAAGGVLIQLMA